ncbi:outer membrane beta-barrel family protein [Pedobacter jeongneungensis]|uniref:outer membrane beta-barrel family protein n=1 Tax=Pedobacter jeongneungensis TaxID=947309 RepID=UPI00046AC329|nr:outer membrane beta-barrel family protein [Pedobacter jeongneungensis]
MKKLTLLLALIVAITTAVSAQTDIQIKGKVLDAKNEPVIFATISLIDSLGKAVNFAISDEQGNYLFNLKQGKGAYKLLGSSMGYASAAVSFHISTNPEVITAPDIILLADTKMLSEVNIKGKKALIEQKIDKLIFNVSQSPMTAGSSALDLLKRAPGVFVDQSDAIKLRGKSVLVLVDNKQIYLSGDQVAQYLKSLQGDNIDKIEIISNPSAKYDAQGVGGIINVISKKDKKIGVNGSVTAGGGYGRNGKYNSSGLLNYRQKMFAVSGNIGYNHDKSPTSGELNRTLSGTDFSQNSSSIKTINSGLAKLSIDFFPNEKNTLGFGFIGNKANNNLANNSLTSLRESGAINQLNLYSANLTDWNSLTYSFNYKLALKKDENLSFDADLSNYENDGDINYTSNNANNQPSQPNTLNINKTMIKIASAKLDYERVLLKKLNLETGAKVSRVTTDNMTRFNQQIDGNWENDVKRSNVFNYDETIVSGYLNLNTKLGKKLSLQLGLRGEQTRSDGDSKTLDSVFRLNYFKLFPSAYITYDFNQNNQLGISYSRRIGRPGYKDLNPFTYYTDQYTASQGNPFLRPSFTNSFELNYTLLQQFNISAGFQHTKDEFEKIAVQEPDTKLVKEIYQNFDKFYGYYIGANIPVKVLKIWEISNYANFYYTDYTMGQIRSKGSALQLNSTSSFTLPKSITAELDMICFYNNAYGIYRVKPNLYFNLGIAKSLSDKRSTFKLSIFDLFNTNRSSITANLGTLNLVSNYRWEGTRANLSYSYKFGKSTVKGAATKRKSSGEEQGRIKN